MAFRLNDMVVCGEISNARKNYVYDRLGLRDEALWSNGGVIQCDDECDDSYKLVPDDLQREPDAQAREYDEYDRSRKPDASEDDGESGDRWPDRFAVPQLRLAKSRPYAIIPHRTGPQQP